MSSRPQRKAPVGGSVLAPRLEVLVEPVSIGGGRDAEASAPAAVVPETTGAPSDQVEADQQTGEVIEASLPAQTLVVEPATDPEPSVDAPTTAEPPAADSAPAEGPAATAPEHIFEDYKRNITVGIWVSLKKRTETAVLRTGGFEGGHSSFASLLESALERELEHLAKEFNDGVPFPMNERGFRTGRPTGR